MSRNDGKAVDQSRTKSFAKGTVICKEGEQDGGEMYVLLMGSAGEYTSYGKPNERLKNALTAGSFYGEMSLFLEKKRESTLVAVTDCVFFQIGRNNINDFLKTDTRVVYELIKSLCSALYAFTGKGDKADESDGASDGENSLEKLFPEGHGRYILPKIDTPATMLYEKTFKCPACDAGFKAVGIKGSKLVQVRTDPDLRVRYKGIEPLYYDIVTCPVCYYSALTESFGNTYSSREKASLVKITAGFKESLNLDLANREDARTVFTSYFIAMHCLSGVMSKPQLALAKLWMKVSRLYDDCEDSAMSEMTARKAMDLYYHAYMNSDIPANQAVQLEYLLGVLSMRFEDFSSARKLFFQVKTNKTASQVIRRMAEDRIEEIKEAKSEG